MFYTMEEAAVLGGFLELYLDRDSVDPAVRERHRKFRQGLMRGALERADYEWAAAALRFLRPQWKRKTNRKSFPIYRPEPDKSWFRTSLQIPIPSWRPTFPQMPPKTAGLLRLFARIFSFFLS